MDKAVWPGGAVEVENARAAASAVPSGLYGRPLEPETDRKPRCACGKVLAWHVTRPWSIRCDRCGATCGRT